VSYAGPAAAARGRLAGGIVGTRLKAAFGITSGVRIDLIGASSLFATAGRAMSESDDVRLHVALRTTDREQAELMLWEVESLLCCGPAGGGGFRGTITPSVTTKSILVERALVKPSCEILVA